MLHACVIPLFSQTLQLAQVIPDELLPKEQKTASTTSFWSPELTEALIIVGGVLFGLAVLGTVGWLVLQRYGDFSKW